MRRSYVVLDDVSGDIGGCSARRALKPKFYKPNQTMVTAGIFHFRENSHGRAGNQTRDLTISSQRDHEVGHIIFLCCAFFYHHGMSRLQIADGGDGLQISSVAAHIPNI